MVTRRRDPQPVPPPLRQGTHAGDPPESNGTVHVVSWNVRFGLEAAAAAEALASVDMLHSADVILLQEMDEDGTELIAERIGVNHVYGALGPHRQTGRNFGNAVLSRWPISEPVVATLPHKSALQGQERLMLGAVVSVDSSPVVACSVHTEVPTLSPPKRRRQFEEIARATMRWDHARLVVGGDFNTLTQRGVAAVDRAMSSVDATRVSVGADPTLRRGSREFSLDHVFARGFEPLDCGVVRDLVASDHRPLWVRLRL
ncbi:endonuclease/exonuclease/phosphatase family protein [Ilumatobacter sp.]|uniref:endonuclease/exonuclease/phosphatase family protein n=1 Tax=Ilumatobacter sp. TaxID=1967498 RepID=UPI003C5DC364